MATAEHASVLPPTNTPKPVSELIDRDAEVDEVVRLASAHRLVTLTGAGGIGKTTLSLALAREVCPVQPHVATWIEAGTRELAAPTLERAPASQATSSRIAGRHHLGISGRLRRNLHRAASGVLDNLFAGPGKPCR